MAKAKVTNRNEALIMKLCINARDAMPTDGRLLTETEMVELDDTYCRSYPHVVRGRYAVVSVSDTGVGMDAETSGYSQDGANLLHGIGPTERGEGRICKSLQPKRAE